MDRKNLLHIIQSVYGELKDFQLATVNYIYHKLYVEKQRRHLVADEVGLGKTIVAKGLIAKAMERHLKSGKRNKPFRVVYICSNLALTGQNLKKLNIFRKKEFLETDRGRLIFQAFKPKNNETFQVSSLTPSTSFRLVKGTGIAEERMLIWMILSKYKIFSRGKRSNGLKLALMGNISGHKQKKGKQKVNIKKWKSNLDAYKKMYENKLRWNDLAVYKKLIAKEKIDLNNPYYKSVREELRLDGEKSLQELLIRYAELLRIDNVKDKEGPKRLLGILRKLLTNVCLKFINADLYILDEFQRFKDLIETDEEKYSEASVIAHQVFKKPKAKILLLSATPFKPFTTVADANFDEDHHKEFKDVLAFLFDQQTEKLNSYEINRKAFFELLRRPENFKGDKLIEKKNLENLYREVLSRTERLLVSDDKNTLLKGTVLDFDLKKEDILNFIKSDSIVNSLNKQTNKNYHSIVDFSKSAPHPLSFMDQYVIKEDLKKNIRKISTIRNEVKKAGEAWLDLEKIKRYKPLSMSPNSNMRELMKHTIDNDMWKQLWIVPSLPYYQCKGSFSNIENASKVLIFSKWKMVPRAIASIISYESEQRSIGNSKIKVQGAKQYIPDFYSNKKKRQPRKPGKILATKLKKGKPQTMSVFTLLYPSRTLAEICKLEECVKETRNITLKEIKETIKKKLNKKIKEAKLENFKKHSRKTVNWYWLAPLLLDKHFYTEDYEYWFESVDLGKSLFVSSKGLTKDKHDDEVKEDGKTSLAHIWELENSFNNPNVIDIGEFPDDLLDVLALQAIASPSIISLRILLKLFQNEDPEILLTGAMNIATQFHFLFDKPESIAVVKISAIAKSKKVVNKTYWKNVLEYCADGNLQSVMDEFAHLVISEHNTLYEFIYRIANCVNMRTANLSIDNGESLIGSNGKKSLQIRCHYAVDFGNQNMDREEGINRVRSILDNFNSPFRPFVLASTSIGQEGLDFHYYCRKVMHWNLPANPIDIEQREGRVNRYKGLVVRQNIVKKYKWSLRRCKCDIWNYMFDKALHTEGVNQKKPELVPYWHIEPDEIHIERIIPLIPFSREVSKLQKLLATLTLYRLTFGQPRQEELVEALYKEYGEEIVKEVREKLMINLSPITYKV